MSIPSLYSYDLIPYESHPFAQSHPDRLATVATLFGLKPPKVSQCRVLEIGCSTGGNILPLAVAYPKSKFVGIDLSAREIEEGQKTVGDLGLANIELRHQSVEAIGETDGKFDYILCHGVFSWVPNPVQEKILEVCNKNLAANGIAYISYNTYPGWHMRGMIRDMMKYHTQHFTEPLVRTKQARNLLDFMARALGKERSPYSLNLKAELELLRQCRDSYLFHEHLEDCNEPIYFHEFAERAKGKGLRYLGEADFSVMVPGNYPPEIANVLHMLSLDLIQMEQYMDFLRNRTFRQTLLCHERLQPNYTLNPATLKTLYIASAAKPVKETQDLASDQAEEFRMADGATLSTKRPIMKAAMAYLAEIWPASVSFETLRAKAHEKLGLTPEPAALNKDAETLASGLLSTYASLANRLVELHTEPLPYTLQVSDKPLASPLARHQAQTSSRVTNLRHEVAEIAAEFDRRLLGLLDGTRDRAALLESLSGAFADGSLVIHKDGQQVQEPQAAQELFNGALDRQLQELAKHALLM